MESSILSLLQGQTPEGSSKWQHLEAKHEVTSSKKDFPLKDAKPKKSSRPACKQTSATYRSNFLKSGCFSSQEVSCSLPLTDKITLKQKSTQAEQMLVSGDSFCEADLVSVIKQALSSEATLHISGSAYDQFKLTAKQAAGSFTELQVQQLYVFSLVFTQSQ